MILKIGWYVTVGTHSFANFDSCECVLSFLYIMNIYVCTVLDVNVHWSRWSRQKGMLIIKWEPRVKTCHWAPLHILKENESATGWEIAVSEMTRNISGYEQIAFWVGDLLTTIIWLFRQYYLFVCSYFFLFLSSSLCVILYKLNCDGWQMYHSTFILAWYEHINTPFNAGINTFCEMNAALCGMNEWHD